MGSAEELTEMLGFLLKITGVERRRERFSSKFVKIF